MNKNSISNVLCAAAALLLLFVAAACSGSDKDEAVLAEKSSDLNVELLQTANTSPDFLKSLSCEYAAPNLLVNVKLDNDINPELYSQALVEYVLANYIRSNSGELMDAIVNGINHTHGSLSITVSNVNEEAKEFTVGHARLVQLVQKKNSELNFNDVKENVLHLLELECAPMAQEIKAESCTFALANGFAQYTFTFATAAKFANQTQGSILGHYLPIVKQQYESYGSCSYLVLDVLKSLQIDGYRFVYTDADESKKISSALPWKML